MASIINVPNETNATYTRTTRDGRKLTYEMSVLQQPQRARACGSGAKSSADRRPVDPPPVVELKILEGENQKDITFQHNANFFLYTTLESARPIASARGNVTAPHPVLTGMPVAGMAYLDRPSQAGYFIFPDLSVRHEGKFRLSFNLYEELKENKDMDSEGTVAPTPTHEGGMMRGSPIAHVHFRLEVKSAPFTVYSAKKFPGLAESTHLSRLVAEQGCRVRIRRDVRMRRREAKPGKEYDGYSDEEHSAYAPPPDRYATPESYHHERAPSVNAPTPTVERRPSTHELPGYYQPPPPQQQQPPQPYAHGPPPPASSGYNSHLQFGPSPTYSSPTYPPSNGPYAYPQPPTSHHRPSSSSGSSYAYPPRPSYAPPPSRPSSYQESEYNRPRAPSATAYSHGGSGLPAVDQSYSGPTYPSHDGRSTPASNPTQLPPLKTLTETKYEQPPTPTSAVPAPSPAAYEAYQPTPTPAPAPTVGKRSYGRTFDDGQSSSGLHNGARPEAVGQDFVQIECEDGTVCGENELPDYKTLTYRRADGSRQHKKITTL